MRAIKLQRHVEGGKPLTLELPSDVHSGEAELIILLEEQPRKDGYTVREFLDRRNEFGRPGRSKEEIDREVQAERDSWD